MYSELNIHVVDLRSDTVTKPSPDMRKAMAEAEVGDDVMREDPTVTELERLSAQLLGKEEGLFVSSGTMGNLIAIMVHTNNQRCAGIIAGDKSHIVCYEQGGAASIANVTVDVVKNNPDGTFDLDLVAKKINHDLNEVHYPLTSLICVENTHNKCGGRVLPEEWLKKVVKLAKEKNVSLHMDGARIFNAAVQSGKSPAEIASGFNSVTFCVSKGLAAPVGSVLVGSKQFIQQARRFRKILGGGMRQAGVIAAAGLYALNNHIERLAEDHKHTYEIAKVISEDKADLLKVDLSVLETNILFIYFNTKKITPDEFCRRMVTVTEKERQELDNNVCGVQMFSLDEKSARIVLHNGITTQDVELVVNKIRHVLKEFNTNLQEN